ncbi:4Fe-4S binding protein [Methanogenium sp. S4BF]|uniref:4Fe-4S binding protein n=1 Tax=Methanogenium sp. S4BF TaxID=1789226 RepID=UPI002415FD9B|nr:4Fe-4S binding protein [Methanogenium sp. S4BF]WFN33667.1 4Fe-4S binding protein [Methanogenium sp. S4BF]
MKRKIISIDEDKCTGCGECIPDCPEGALLLIDGKARLVSDLFCDGLGACIGTCPEGAISVVEREAEAYDEQAVMATIVRQGEGVIRAHLEHLAGHGQTELYHQAIAYLKEHTISIPDHNAAECAPKPGPGGTHSFAGCPGTAAQSIARDMPGGNRAPSGDAPSELRQWPVQLTLLNPGAPYFDNADLLISADCVPFAYAGFHAELLRDRIVIIFCPKLDADIDRYITKLAEIFTLHTIKSITIARMEVPCCGGVRYVVDRALEKSRTTIPVTEKTITIQGKVV